MPMPNRTVKSVLITFTSPARLGFTNNLDYPLAVCLVFEDDSRGQEHQCRSMRDARLFANGTCSGLLHALGTAAPVKPTVDPRLLEQPCPAK